MSDDRLHDHGRRQRLRERFAGERFRTPGRPLEPISLPDTFAPPVRLIVRTNET
jgi:hypothetical protein